MCWRTTTLSRRTCGGKRLRLLGFEGVVLKSGESQDVKQSADPWALARFDSDTSAWRVAEDNYWVHLLGRIRQIS